MCTYHVHTLKLSPLFLTVQDALSSLEGEIVPDTTPVAATTKYRKSLAIGLFYKV